MRRRNGVEEREKKVWSFVYYLFDHSSDSGVEKLRKVLPRRKRRKDAESAGKRKCVAVQLRWLYVLEYFDVPCRSEELESWLRSKPRKATKSFLQRQRKARNQHERVRPMWPWIMHCRIHICETQRLETSCCPLPKVQVKFRWVILNEFRMRSQILPYDVIGGYRRSREVRMPLYSWRLSAFYFLSVQLQRDNRGVPLSLKPICFARPGMSQHRRSQ